MKIIAVDDDKVSLELLGECLVQGGYENIDLEPSPQTALTKISDTDQPYDCILLDVDMPGMDGIELCSEIRKLDHHKNTPVLMITRYKHRSAVQTAFVKGATDYITKPFEFLEVLTRIKVAERLVQERRAALDSYMAVHTIEEGRQKTAPILEVRRPERTEPLFDPNEIQSADDSVLSPAVFQNYLEQMSKASSCDLNLVAVQIRRIDRIFRQTSAADFTAFLQSAAHAIVHHFRPNEVFVSQAGNGTFLAALDASISFMPDHVESEIVRSLSPMSMPKAFGNDPGLEVIVGTPLHLPTSPKLNFRRAVKAATARMKQRAQDLHENQLTALTS